MRKDGVHTDRNDIIPQISKTSFFTADLKALARIVKKSTKKAAPQSFRRQEESPQGRYVYLITVESTDGGTKIFSE